MGVTAHEIHEYLQDSEAIEQFIKNIKLRDTPVDEKEELKHAFEVYSVQLQLKNLFANSTDLRLQFGTNFEIKWFYASNFGDSDKLKEAGITNYDEKSILEDVSRTYDLEVFFPARHISALEKFSVNDRAFPKFDRSHLSAYLLTGKTLEDNLELRTSEFLNAVMLNDLRGATNYSHYSSGELKNIQGIIDECIASLGYDSTDPVARHEFATKHSTHGGMIGMRDTQNLTPVSFKKK